MAERKFDLIIFGATGFTGKYCVRELVSFMLAEKKVYRFAIAGRNKQRLTELLKSVEYTSLQDAKADKDLIEQVHNTIKQAEVITADVDDFNSLCEMTSQCIVLINLVGPYTLYGLQVVQACVQTETHYVDICGEPLFLEKAQLQFHEEAKEKGVYVVSACGFDCIPSDCGTLLLQETYPDLHINHVEAFVKIDTPDGLAINHGTLDSLINSLLTANQLRKVRTGLFPLLGPQIPKFEHKLKLKFRPTYDLMSNLNFIPFVTTDETVIRRTQTYLFNKEENFRPLQFKHYLGISSRFLYYSLILWMPILSVLFKFEWGRKLIQRYPDYLTLGVFKKKNVLGSGKILRVLQKAQSTAICISPETEYQYIERSCEPTNKYQATLPLLPIPTLEDTCARYLEALRPLISNPTILTESEKRVDEFYKNCGKQLDHELRKRSQELTDRPYYFDDWLFSYLVHRDPIPIHMNPYLLLKKDPSGIHHVPARTTSLLISLLRYRHSLLDNCLTPLKVDMSPYPDMFGTTRIPQKDVDALHYYEHSKHVVFMRHGQIYKFDVLDDQGALRPASEIGNFIAGFYEHTSEPNNNVLPIGVLTSESRETWAAAREHLSSLGEKNQENLKIIDSALMVICLDDENYDALDESALASALLHGLYHTENTTAKPDNLRLNRWFDKSTQLIISCHGEAGVNFEHSWGDGAIVLNTLNRVHEDLKQQRFDESPSPVSAGEVENSLLNFTVDERLRNDVETAIRNFRKFSSSVSMRVVEYGAMNRSYLKEKQISPDFVFQMAFQMANYRIFTKTSPTYEACSTGSFRLGRTENIRAATFEMKNACKALAWGEKKYTYPEIRASLVEASKKHQKLSKLASQGQGCDRHLFAMKCLARKLDMSMPSLFTDPSYEMANSFILSTSHLYGNNVRGGGYGPVVADGFGLGYGFTENGMNLNCTSFEQQSADDFAQAFLASLQEINNVLERS